MKCWLCESELVFKDDQALFCPFCSLLYNPHAKNKDYFLGSSQDISDFHKAYLRKLNSEQRWKIIGTHLSSKRFVFIDVGCGSEEMLEVAKDYTYIRIGFELNRELVKLLYE